MVNTRSTRLMVLLVGAVSVLVGCKRDSVIIFTYDNTDTQSGAEPGDTGIPSHQSSNNTNNAVPGDTQTQLQPTPLSPLVLANCPDGIAGAGLTFDPLGDLTTWQTAYDPVNRYSWTVTYLEKRHPPCAYIIKRYVETLGLNFDQILGWSWTGSMDQLPLSQLIEDLPTICYSAGINIDWEQSTPTTGYHYVYDGLTYTVPLTDPLPPVTIIENDGYSSDCAQPYMDLFTNHRNFDDFLFDMNQMMHSIGVCYNSRDFDIWYGIIHDDALAAYLWYIERYLYLLERNYPERYAHLLTTKPLMEATLGLWGIAATYQTRLVADGYPVDQSLNTCYQNETLMSQIDKLRQAFGCQ